MKKKILTFLIIFGGAGFAGAQDMKTEVQIPATINDSRTNSDSVPSEYSIDSKFERVVIVRLKNRSDLLRGIEEAVKANGIQNGVILSGIGSVTSYNYHVVGNSSFPIKNIFVKNDSSGADIASMNGYIVGGRVHVHVTFANAEKAFGGHLEPGTLVFTFAIATVGVLSDSTDLTRIDDWNYR
jgi:predicted DNA-binding protein with PD1-like motif